MSREYEQQSSFQTPISKGVIDRTLREASLEERLNATVYIKDILANSHDDAIATWLIFYSAAIMDALCSSDTTENPECGNTFMVGSLFMYHLKNNQDLKYKEKNIRLSMKNLPEYTESLFPVEFGGTRSLQIRDHNDVLIKAIQYGDTLPNEDYIQHLSLYRDDPAMIREPFAQQLERHRDEFKVKEPVLFELSTDETLKNLSIKNQGAFWSGLISTYYLLKTDEELNQLEGILKSR